MSSIYRLEYIKLKKQYLRLKKQLKGGIKEEVNIRLMEFNIEDGGTLVNFDTVIEAIKVAKPDIVAIEEAYGNLPEIAKRIEFPYYNTRTQIISKFPIIDPCDGNGVYMFIEVLPGKIIALSNVHLPSDPYGPDILHRGATFERVTRLENKIRYAALQRQLDNLPNLVNAGIPVFLTGDFNVPSHLDCKKEISDNCLMWPISMKLQKLGFHDSYREIYKDPKTNPGFTWWVDRPKVEGWNPSPKDIHDRIDFIYFAGPTKINESIIIGEKGAKDVDIEFPIWPSDHRAILSSFSITAADMPTLIYVNKRLIDVGDELQIKYCISEKDKVNKIIIKPTDSNKEIFKYEIDGKSNDINYKVKMIGSFEACLVNIKNEIVCKIPFYAKKKDVGVILETKESYKSGDQIDVTWKNGPGNRFDWIGIRNTHDADDKFKFQGASTNTKIEGSVSFTKDNIDRWPLNKGEYEIVYMIDDSHVSLARTTIIIK